MGFKERSWVIISIFLIIGLIFIIRLFFLQVTTDYWAQKAASITEKKITTYPARGLIYDRNENLMVANKAVYDLMVLPADVKKSGFDSIGISNLLGITKEDYRSYLNCVESVAEKFIDDDNVFSAEERASVVPGDAVQSGSEFPGEPTYDT